MYNCTNNDMIVTRKTTINLTFACPAATASLHLNLYDTWLSLIKPNFPPSVIPIAQHPTSIHWNNNQLTLFLLTSATWVPNQLHPISLIRTGLWRQTHADSGLLFKMNSESLPSFVLLLHKLKSSAAEEMCCKKYVSTNHTTLLLMRFLLF